MKVSCVVAQAKELGATRVILRTGQRSFRVREILGLPVADVSNHVGPVDGLPAEVFRNWPTRWEPEPEREQAYALLGQRRVPTDWPGFVTAPPATAFL